jgi:ribosomal protein L37AE/L43A
LKPFCSKTGEAAEANMIKNRKAEAMNFGSKTNFADKQKEAFSSFDYGTGLEPIATIMKRVIEAGKVVRLYRCFACKRHFPASRMASALIVCRECLKGTQGKGRLARLNQIDRITNDLRIFLRGRLEAK